MSSADEIVSTICDHYLTSGDFNGLPLSSVGGVAEEARALVRELIAQGDLAVVTGDNPYIRHFPDPPPEKQLALMDESGSVACLYPTMKTLRDRPEIAEYADRPFTRRLALGEAQLAPLFFELDVLDRYRRDARYHYRFEDYTGHISIGDAAYFDEITRERDKVSLQTFGIAWRDNGLRAVVVYLRYLSGLSPEHQQLWNAYRLDEVCRIASPYVDETLGIWREEDEVYGSVYQAFLEEQELINAMCQAMGRPQLFRETWKHNRPREFSPFMLPTKRSYNEFVHTLDKMLSDNIRSDFFRDDVPRERDGQRLSSLALLEAWLSRPVIRWRAGSGAQLVEPWKEVRKLRQKPAHAIEDDQYDVSLYKQQNEVIERVYLALAAMRQVLSTHRLAKSVEVPKWIREGRIRHY